jgi:hypothetical protein
VLDVARRLYAVIVAVGLVAGQTGLCAGWLPTAEARMDCCTDGSCPMHKGEHQPNASGRSITQTEADACCASAKEGQSGPSAPTAASAVSIAVLGPGTLAAAPTPALVLSDSWRVHAPVPLDSPPRHVLLSTFLI